MRGGKLITLVFALLLQTEQAEEGYAQPTQHCPRSWLVPSLWQVLLCLLLSCGLVRCHGALRLVTIGSSAWLRCRASSRFRHVLVQVCLQRGRATVRKGNLYVPGGINRDRRNWGRWVGRPNCFLDLVLFGLRQVVRINHVDRLPRVQWVFIRIRLARYQVVTWNRIRRAIRVRDGHRHRP